MAESWSSFDLHLDWRPGDGRRALADALRRAIRDGRLPPGSTVPSTRVLAKDLGMARGTVTRIYADLTAEGYLYTSQGAPTKVTTRGGPALAPPKEGIGPRAAPWVPDVRWDFYPGRPDLSSFPRTAWLSASRRVLHEAPASVFDYSDAYGPIVLRRALAHYLARSRGVVADPERIVVCGGFKHALTTLGRVLADRGEIAFEDPSLPEFRAAATHGGARVTGVPVDEHGIRVSELDSPVVVVTPAHQYPLGVTLAPQRRTALARWASETGGLVIEDDYDGEFRFDREPVGALQALAPERIIYAGTVSKTLSPALGIGWLVLPRALVEPVRAALSESGWRTPMLDHLVLADLLTSGVYERHVRQRRAAYRKRRDRLLAALPAGFTPGGISAGLHVVLGFTGVGEAEAIATLLRHSVAVDGLGRHWLGEHRRPGLVVGYATPAEHAFGPALDALVTALREISP
ncbi:PLP-dependent aminotransferase family protein [Amycolatopsis taiwanensis]|uniref:GntR family transcriptional regulator n=1 Tax=Amycolatopsis taiwanensis TaxID=342230 RepID=A0A9W6QXL9_9PSEU|nr:PLP-dependent aminotransferase family protein [Amycolatopsis taiwanensis]GLY65899.1 GntR family transcriptional regulator [Amycolatopsis taiwanensis]